MQLYRSSSCVDAGGKTRVKLVSSYIIVRARFELNTALRSRLSADGNLN